MKIKKKVIELSIIIIIIISLINFTLSGIYSDEGFTSYDEYKGMGYDHTHLDSTDFETDTDLIDQLNSDEKFQLTPEQAEGIPPDQRGIVEEYSPETQERFIQLDADNDNIEVEELPEGSEIEDKILSTPDGSSIDLETFDKEEHSFKKTEDGIEVDGNEFQQAENLRYEEDVLKADGVLQAVINSLFAYDYEFNGRVEYLEDGDTTLFSSLNPRSHSNTISVDNVFEVQSKDQIGQNIFRELDKSVFNIDNEGKLISADITSNVDNNKVTLARPELEIIVEENGHLKLEDNTYELTNGKITYTSDEIIETVTTQGKSTIILDFSQSTGFYSLILPKGAEYKLEHKTNTDLNFKIIPKTDNYKIFIKKVGGQGFNIKDLNKNSAFIDLKKNKIQMNGLADLYKEEKIIESNDINNEFTLTEFKNLKLTNNEVGNSNIAIIKISKYTIKEILTNGIHTIAEFSTTESQITSYKHEFNLPHTKATIEIKDNNLIQTSDNNEIILSDEKNNLIKEITEYKTDICNSYNTYYNDNQHLPTFLEKLMPISEITSSIVGVQIKNKTQPIYLFLLIGILTLATITLYIKKSNKKSQISMFIFIGILILVITLIMFSVISKATESTQTTIKQPELTTPKGYTQNCLEKVAQCSLLYQGLNYDQIKQTFNQQTKEYLDTTSIKCYHDMPEDLKQNTKVTYFESEVIYKENSIINVKTDMTIKNDLTETGIYDYELEIPIKVKQLIDFSDNINEIDLTYLAKSDYNVNIYKIEDQILYVITDPNSKLFNKEYKLITSFSS